MSYNKLLRLLRLSRLYRILRLFNFMRIFEVLQQNKTYEKILIALKMNSGIKRLIKAILTFFFLCHLFACFWFYIARFNNFDPDTWYIYIYIYIFIYIYIYIFNLPLSGHIRLVKIEVCP